MNCNNIYKPITETLDSTCIGTSKSTAYGINRGISASEKILPDFKVPEGFTFAIKIINQSNQTVLEKNFDNNKEFETFCNKCTHIESAGFFSTSFKTARVNSIADFAKTFFFPATTMYPIAPAAYLLAIIWDLSTLFCRFLTLPYRFYEYHHTPQHPLLAELKNAGRIKNATGPYLDVHFRAKKCDGVKNAEVSFGKRIFFERHTPYESSSYFKSENSLLDKNYFNFDGHSSYCPPASKASSRHPNPKTQKEIEQRLAEKPFVLPTRDEALGFFGLASNFTQQELGQKYRQKFLQFHPDKPGGSTICCKWLNQCRDVLKT